MIGKLLQQSKVSLSQTMELKIRANDNKCKSIYLQIQTHNEKNNQRQIYAQTISIQDFINKKKQNESILFLKLVLEKYKINVIYVKNIIWEKVVIGKDRADAALENMMKLCNNKQYLGIVLSISYPQHIIIVLPKILIKVASVRKNQNEKQQEQNRIKKIFFSKQQIKQEKLLKV